MLVNARLFDGPVSDNVELVPDSSDGTTWSVAGYQSTGRTLRLRCEYKNGYVVTVLVEHSAKRCYFKGKSPAVARCVRK